MNLIVWIWAKYTLHTLVGIFLYMYSPSFVFLSVRINLTVISVYVQEKNTLQAFPYNIFLMYTEIENK